MPKLLKAKKDLKRKTGQVKIRESDYNCCIKRAEKLGFTSFSAYVRALIKKDLKKPVQ